MALFGIIFFVLTKMLSGSLACCITSYKISNIESIYFLSNGHLSPAGDASLAAGQSPPQIGNNEHFKHIGSLNLSSPKYSLNSARFVNFSGSNIEPTLFFCFSQIYPTFIQCTIRSYNKTFMFVCTTNP